MANYALAIFVFKASPWTDLMLVFSALGLVSLVSVLGGLVLSRGVCEHSPLEILRGGS
jgi:putative ABC transport system permease protein